MKDYTTYKNWDPEEIRKRCIELECVIETLDELIDEQTLHIKTLQQD